MIGGSSTTDGIYSMTNDSADAAPNNRVWKHSEGNDRYIFNTGSSTGWRIGRNGHLSTSNYYYKSKIFLRF